MVHHRPAGQSMLALDPCGILYPCFWFHIETGAQGLSKRGQTLGFTNTNVIDACTMLRIAYPWDEWKAWPGNKENDAAINRHHSSIL